MGVGKFSDKSVKEKIKLNLQKDGKVRMRYTDG